MADARYELRVAGCLSERARWAFPGMQEATVRPQTSICAEIDDGWTCTSSLNCAADWVFG